MNKETFKPRRSFLYMPGSNERAMKKARTLEADCLIFDLEDAVAPDAKALAREKIRQNLESNNYPNHELLIRINALDTRWGKDDLSSLLGLSFDGIVLPKVESRSLLEKNINQINTILGQALPIWIMTETPVGVHNAFDTYASSRQIEGVLMGTADLGKELRILGSTDRFGLIAFLSQCVLAARVNDLDIIDGIFPNLNSPENLQIQCEQGKNLGFDGKSLIHPQQIDVCNSVYSPTNEQLQNAQRILEAWQDAIDGNRGVCVVDGQLVEVLHVEQAKRLLQVATAVENKQG